MMQQTGGTNAGSNSYTKQSTSCYTFSLNERSGCMTNNDNFNNTYSTYTISLGYARSRIYYIEKKHTCSYNIASFPHSIHKLIIHPFITGCLDTIVVEHICHNEVHYEDCPTYMTIFTRNKWLSY